MTPDTSERPAVQDLSPRPRAGIYARAAVDPAGLRVARQESLCREYALEQGWQVTTVYVDNDVSSYRPKSRPAFDQMMAGLDGLDRLVVVHLDRLTRTPRDLEAVYDGLEQHNVELHEAIGGRVDPIGLTYARIITAAAQQVERQS